MVEPTEHYGKQEKETVGSDSVLHKGKELIGKVGLLTRTDENLESSIIEKARGWRNLEVVLIQP